MSLDDCAASGSARHDDDPAVWADAVPVAVAEKARGATQLPAVGDATGQLACRCDPTSALLRFPLQLGAPLGLCPPASGTLLARSDTGAALDMPGPCLAP